MYTKTTDACKGAQQAHVKYTKAQQALIDAQKQLQELHAFFKQDNIRSYNQSQYMASIVAAQDAYSNAEHHLQALKDQLDQECVQQKK